MENFKGTTGEWSINTNDTGHITSVRSVQAGRTIFTSKVNNLEESNANMNLALHSKEMLKELNNIVECWDNDIFQELDIDCIRELIKKATE